MNTVYVDFEYRESGNQFLTCLCAATLSDDGAKTWWFNFPERHATDPKRNEEAYEFVDYMKEYDEVVCYNTSAEVRAFISAGIDPTKFKWIDLYLEYAQLRNNNPKYKYGKVKNKDGKIIVSTPSTRATDEGWRLEEEEIEEINAYGNHAPVGSGLLSACLNLLNVDLDLEHKTKMRNLILRKPYRKFTDSEKENIMSYCMSDVRYLPALHEALNKLLKCEVKHQHLRGRFGMYMAMCENNGIPISEGRFKRLGENHHRIIDSVIEECIAVHPFYSKADKWKDTMESKGTYDWCRKKQVFDDYVKSTGIDWPVTDKGAYKADDATLSDYSYLPPIAAFKECKKQVQQLSWFRGEGLENMLERMGYNLGNKSWRMRPWFNPYGTQTSRNAPPAKQFIFAMSSFLRCLIDPPEGYAITGIDWASQEFIVAAVLSKDKNMIAAYQSKDPYLWLAKKAKLCPEDATKDHPMRDVCKVTALSIQYGAGANGVSLNLTNATGKVYTKEQAMRLIEVHQKAFPKFWQYNEEIAERYKSTDVGKVALSLLDGWRIYRCENKQGKSINSIKNFPVQGTSALIMRQAIHNAITEGLEVLCPLHDCIYILHKTEDTEEAGRILQREMDRAVGLIFTKLGFPNVEVRGDKKTIKHGEIWTEKKGMKMFEKTKQHIFTPEELLRYEQKQVGYALEKLDGLTNYLVGV